MTNVRHSQAEGATHEEILRSYSSLKPNRNTPSLVACCAMLGQVYVSQDSGETWTKTQMPLELSRGRHIYPMAFG